MDISKIVGQKVVTADGLTLTIMNLDGQYLQLSNGKLYSFELAYNNGFIKFKEAAMQKEVKEHFEDESKKKAASSGGSDATAICEVKVRALTSQ